MAWSCCMCFAVLSLFIKLSQNSIALGNFSTVVTYRWSDFIFHKTTANDVNYDTIVVSTSVGSLANCALICFNNGKFPSLYFVSETDTCHCNNKTEIVSQRTSIGPNSTVVLYAECAQRFDDGFDISLPIQTFKRDCKDLHDSGILTNGVYSVSPDGGDPFQVYCDMDGGGWTVFQRREDGSVDFYLEWNSYKEGFGDLMGEHWLGLDFLYRLVQEPSELYIELAAFDTYSGQTTGYAKYSTFSIEDEANFYRLTVSGFTGDAGDSMAIHNGQKFSTKDKDNDPFSIHCAVVYKGAWWYQMCHQSNLNGLYLAGPTTSFADGVNWETGWGHNYSLKKTVMKTRRK